jgi:hypothetical protein
MAWGLACKIYIWDFRQQGQMIGKEWPIQDINDESLCLTKAWMEFGMTYVNWTT